MDILFIDNSTKLESVTFFKPRGGMVTSLFKVTDYLSSKGHSVTVLSDVKFPGLTYEGVSWVNEDTFDWEDEYDFIVFNRGIGSGMPSVKSKHRVLWTHDLPHAGFIENPKLIKSFSATVFMSQYAEKIWRFYYKEIGKSFFIPNGVDKSIFYPREKDFNYLIYSSAPNRGLNELPFILDCLREKTGKSLYLNAYSNLSVLHPNEEDIFGNDYEEVKKSLVNLKDPIPQEELGEEIGKAGLMIIPSDYPEICSNTILQSIACGTPVVTTGNLGSACEWVNEKNGRLTEFHKHDYMVYKIDLLRKCDEILSNKKLHNKLIEGCLKTKIYTWNQIGDSWIQMLNWLY